MKDDREEIFGDGLGQQATPMTVGQLHDARYLRPSAADSGRWAPMMLMVLLVVAVGVVEAIMFHAMWLRINTATERIAVLEQRITGEDYVMAQLALAKWMNDDLRAVNAALLASGGNTNDCIAPLLFPYRGRNLEAGFSPTGLVFVRDVGPNGQVPAVPSPAK